MTTRSPSAQLDQALDGAHASGFTLISRREVPMLRLQLEHYRHAAGAEHFHMASQDEHRAFNLAFRTLPADSTGLPHILEHLVLCGSRHYPVRDPFFMMLRRSLNTFMNAMTGGETTYYPFASQVEKDFQNLLGIYLDATFAPNLHPLDFAQEGWRLEPRSVLDADPGPGDWQLKGVVYNEMKGAMGNSDARMADALGAGLLPDTVYRHNSGGDPEVIPGLGHQDLVDFHRRHYNAANACLVTYGKLDVVDLHARIEPYLRSLPGEPVEEQLLQPAIRPPERIEVAVPLEAGQDPRDVSLGRLVWVWPDCSSLSEILRGELLDLLLLGHAGAPLRLSLESSGLGRALGWSGFNTMGRNGIFAASLKGMDPEDYESLPPLVMEQLERLAGEGFPADEIEAALHQLELGRRRISGDRFPFGLELSMRVLEAWRGGQDPLDFLDMETALEHLREEAGEPGFWQRFLSERLLDNPHRSYLEAIPDPDFNAQRDAEERQRVTEQVAQLTAGDRDGLLRQARDLAERQAGEDDPTVLPDLQRSDVPSERPWAEGRRVEGGLRLFPTATNGILHQVVSLPLQELSAEELSLLPLLTRAIGELGVGDHDYRAQAARLNALCGGVSAWTDLRGWPDDLGRLQGRLFLEVSGLARRHADWSGLLAETLAEQRFDEQDRLRELLQQSLAGLMQQVAYSGHGLAQSAAARGFGGPAGLSHEMGGLGRLAWLKGFEAQARHDPTRVADLAERLAALLENIRRAPLRLALIGDAAGEDEARASLARAWEGWPRDDGAEPQRADLPLPAAFDAAPTAYTTASQVSYCALAFPTVPLDHPDSPALAVAARYLTYNHLHRHLREQGGAYGGRAGFSSQTGLFGLTSYRDPRLAETYQDMRAGLAWLAECPEDERLLKEAVLGVIGDVDRPGSPAGEGRRRFVADLFGFGPEVIDDWRQKVLALTGDEMRQAARRWLPADGGSQAVLTSEALIEASGLGWQREAI